MDTSNKTTSKANQKIKFNQNVGQQSNEEKMQRVHHLNDRDIFQDINAGPARCRDLFHQKILDQSVDSKELSMYISHFSKRTDLISNTPQNQKFWTEVEYNFVQTYTEDTEADFNFKIDIDILKSYFECVAALNNEGLCQLANSSSVPMMHIMKRNFLRHKELHSDDIKQYLTIVDCIVKSKALRIIFDSQVRERILHFFNDNKHQLTLANFKKLSLALQNFKFPKNSEQYKLLESCVQQKFVEFYPQMDVNDIIVISRLLFRGPELTGVKVIPVSLEEFMIKNQERYIGGLSKAHANAFKDNSEQFNKCMLYFEGTIQLQKLSELVGGITDVGMGLTEVFSKSLNEIKHNLTHQNMSRLCQTIVFNNQKIENSPTLQSILMDYIEDNFTKSEFPKETKLNLSRIVELVCLDKSKIKGFLSESITTQDINSSNNIQWQRAELYIKSVLEIEGKSISQASVQQIAKLVNDSNTNMIATYAAKLLGDFGITFEMAPEAWKAIHQNVLKYQELHIQYASLRSVAQDIAKSGYLEEEFWKEIRNTIVSHHRKFDGQTIIDLRNTHVEYFPQQRAIISFLEQKQIAIFYMFGKSQKSVLYAGAGKNKKHLRVPEELNQALNEKATKHASDLARKTATVIKKLVV